MGTLYNVLFEFELAFLVEHQQQRFFLQHTHTHTHAQPTMSKEWIQQRMALLRKQAGFAFHQDLAISILLCLMSGRDKHLVLTAAPHRLQEVAQMATMVSGCASSNIHIDLRPRISYHDLCLDSLRPTSYVKSSRHLLIWYIRYSLPRLKITWMLPLSIGTAAIIAFMATRYIHPTRVLLRSTIVLIVKHNPCSITTIHLHYHRFLVSSAIEAM